MAPADSPYRVHYDASRFTPAVLTKMIDCHLGRVIGVPLAPQEIDRSPGEGETDYLFAISGYGGSASVIGKNSAADERGIADPADKLVG